MSCKVLVTGGHLTPALATIDVLLKENVEVVFVGKPRSLKTNDDESEMIKRKITFVGLKTGKLHRHSFVRAFLSLLILPIALVNAIRIIRKSKPNVILSFGGYISVPLVFAGWLIGIPSITHEQTNGAGLANKINGLFVKKIALAFDDSKNFFPTKKTVVLGNPIRFNILNENKELKSEIKKPFLYVTGGHQGSAVINNALFNILDELIGGMNVIHSIGVSAKLEKDWQLAEKAMGIYPKRYIAQRYFGSNEVGWVMKNSTLIVSRAGANTCTEIAHLNKPCILIPLPEGQNNEQLVNARLLEKLGLAIVIIQSDLEQINLLNKIRYVDKNLDIFNSKLDEIKKYFPTDAADRLAQLVMTLCKK